MPGRIEILCTLGPQSLAPDTIERLDEVGVSLFRINLSHTPVSEIEQTVELIRAHSGTPICLDTQGAQVRTGPLSEGHVRLATNTWVQLVAAPTIGHETALSLYPGASVGHLAAGDLIHVDFHAALLQVTEAGDSPRALVVNGGDVRANMAISIDRPIPLPPLTDADREAIAMGVDLGIDQFALSFASGGADIDLLRRISGVPIRVIAKVESQRGVRSFDAILDAADAILIDRGDLSREVPSEQLPFVQKRLIRAANQRSVPVYVATNLLESMVSAPRPTRAEVNDVINTLMDGADGLVLAAETAIGKYPVQSTSMIRGLIRQHHAESGATPPAASASPTSSLIAPHGGALVTRVMRDWDGDRTTILELPQLEADQRIVADARQLAVGTFSPLEGFMNRDELESVLATNRLPDGTAWSMPIVLQLPVGAPSTQRPGESITLTVSGEPQAVVRVEESYTYDLGVLAERWFGTDDRRHPGVAELLERTDRFVAGKVDLLAASVRGEAYELTPRQTRTIFEHRQWQRVVGFHTRNAAHRAHEYLQAEAMRRSGCDGILIQPVIGDKKAGDFTSSAIVRSYELLRERGHWPAEALLGGFATYSRYAGPREAVFTAICRQNFGCSHFIVGRDHTGVGDFYAADETRHLFEDLGLDIQLVTFDEVAYCPRCNTYTERCDHPNDRQRISGTAVREAFQRGEAPPDWAMRDEVSQLLLQDLADGKPVFVPDAR